MNTLLLKKELATMMMFVPIVAVGAAALGLTVSSVRNMAQTFQVAKAAAPPFSTWVPPATPHEAVSQLESMKRKELLELFLSFKAPSNLSDIEGEWNGCLLENNGWILTTVTRFLTNVIFGKGRKWNGKAFRANKKGVNRFHSKQINDTDYQHEFDYSLEPSRIGTSHRSSISLCFSKYQFPLSLWHSMRDELKCVPVGNGDEKVQVLIGFGSMSWSGGKLNASPFCLWRANNDDEIQ